MTIDLDTIGNFCILSFIIVAPLSIIVLLISSELISKIDNLKFELDIIERQLDRIESHTNKKMSKKESYEKCCINCKYTKRKPGDEPCRSCMKESKNTNKRKYFEFRKDLYL